MPILFLDILILSGVATVTAVFSHFLRLPIMIGFVITGVLIGPHSFKLVSSLPDAYSLTELASVILMFTIGLEFSFLKLKELHHQLLKLGTAQVLITIAAVFSIGYSLSYPLNKALLWGFMISLSSTALVLKLLHDYRDIDAPHGKNSIGILLFQDLIVIPMILIIPLLSPGSNDTLGVTGFAVFLWLGKVAAIAVVLYITKQFLLSFILERVVATRSHELFLISIIFICLGTGYLFHLVGLSLSIGAFIAGAIVSESAFGHQATSIFTTLRDTFLGLFFVTIGMLLDVKFMVINFSLIMMLGLGFFFLKSGIVFLVCLVNRTSVSVALLTALSISQVGEFSFLIASQAADLNLLDTLDSQYFMAISVLSMMFTPLMYLMGPKIVQSRPFVNWKSLNFLPESISIKRRLRKQSSKTIASTGHNTTHIPETIVIGYGIAGHNVVSALQDLLIPYHVIESNYELVKKAKLAGITICFGNAKSHDILNQAGIEHAKIVVIAISDTHSIPGIIGEIRKVRPDVPIIVRIQYTRNMANLKLDPRITVVIAEIETATELVANVLKGYGLPSQLIFDYALQAKQQLIAHGVIGTGHRYNILSLPSWDTLTSIRPLQIEKEYFAAGKTLAELALLERTGGLVVSVFRKGMGTKIPGRDFTLLAGDIIHVISSPECAGELADFLKKGQTINEPQNK